MGRGQVIENEEQEVKDEEEELQNKMDWQPGCQAPNKELDEERVTY